MSVIQAIKILLSLLDLPEPVQASSSILVKRIPAVKELHEAEELVDYDPSATVSQVNELHPGFSQEEEERSADQGEQHPSRVQRPIQEPYPFTLLSPITTFDADGSPTPPPGILRAKPGREAIVLYNEVMQYVSS